MRHFLRSWTTDEASSGTEDSSSHKVSPGWGRAIGTRPGLRCRAGLCYAIRSAVSSAGPPLLQRSHSRRPVGAGRQLACSVVDTLKMQELNWLLERDTTRNENARLCKR